MADLSEALREEELKAWQRLVRVLGHELNNSLAPIKSIAGSLSSLIKRPVPRPADWEEDMRNGLDIIASRAEGLSRFMQAYSRLAKLPKPAKSACEVKPLVHRVVQLELRLPVTVVGGPDITVPCDGPQIEQVLINLLKNAVEATLEASESDSDSDSESEPPMPKPLGGVRLSWQVTRQMLEFRIEDDGPGIGQATNLFVPFFTTKPTGSGIGLVLCRQIAENHEGELFLENRTEAPGTTAVLQLPMQ